MHRLKILFFDIFGGPEKGLFFRHYTEINSTSWVPLSLLPPCILTHCFKGEIHGQTETIIVLYIYL